ncbi:MAG: DUF6266 family protein [Paludibacter sp.]
MARFKSSTFGKISGKYGDAIAVVRKDGLCILKEYVKPSNPNSPKQQAQRTLFQFGMKELNYFRSVFTITFDGQYGINRALSFAMKTSIEGEFPNYTLDYRKLIISNGKLEKLALLDVKQQVGYTVRIEWNLDDSIGVSPEDKVNLVFLNPASKVVLFKQDVALRSMGTIEEDLPTIWKGLLIHGWLYLSSPISKSFSTSQYIGLIQL